MILPFFYRVDERGHEMTRARRVFELVAAGANRQVKARQIRLIVNGNPVGGNVVHADNAAGFLRNLQIRNAMSQPVHLCFPHLISDMRLDFIGIGHPLFGVAGRVGAADEDVVARFGPEVDAAVGVRKDEAFFVKVEPFG